MSNLGKNWLEWTVFALSSVLVLTLVSFLGWSQYKHTGKPARIELFLETPVRVGKTWQVPIEAENKGDQSSEGVEIEVEWKTHKQTAHFTFPELPRAGKRSGTAVFQAVGDEILAASDLEAHVVGYEEG